MIPRYNRSRRAQWTSLLLPALALLMLLAFGVVGCSLPGSPGASSATATAGRAGTPTSTSTPLSSADQTQAALKTPSITVPPGGKALNVTFNEQYAFVTCDSSQPAGANCLTFNGNGTAASLGALTLARTAVYAPAQPGQCAAATTRGTLTLANNDTISFTGSGQFCPGTVSATYTYTIAGGTGAYQNATGSGTITTPAPDSSNTGTEIWAGTVTQ
ncbi:MAG TPA: hypothetical protein VMV29_19750 [Ktedonobacterales bacterium]|nr:hypothetical protein [Ktedonobacterales bacterium]